jgi:hypothetical protein
LEIWIENREAIAEPVLSLGAIASYPLIPLVILNFFYAFALMRTLAKVVTQEGKNSDTI